MCNFQYKRSKLFPLKRLLRSSFYRCSSGRHRSCYYRSRCGTNNSRRFHIKLAFRLYIRLVKFGNIYTKTITKKWGKVYKKKLKYVANLDGEISSIELWNYSTLFQYKHSSKINCYTEYKMLIWQNLRIFHSRCESSKIKIKLQSNYEYWRIQHRNKGIQTTTVFSNPLQRKFTLLKVTQQWIGVLLSNL